MAEDFPNMGKEIVSQVQVAQRVPGRINPRKNILRHTVIKLTKTKDRDKILKATRELPSSYQLILNRNYIQSDEREEPTTKETLPRETLLQI